MDNFKNISIAAFSSIPSAIMAIETEKLVAIISTLVLPILFFCIGKTVDVLVQIYFRRQEAKRLAQKAGNLEGYKR